MNTERTFCFLALALFTAPSLAQTPAAPGATPKSQAAPAAPGTQSPGAVTAGGRAAPAPAGGPGPVGASAPTGAPAGARTPPMPNVPPGHPPVGGGHDGARMEHSVAASDLPRGSVEAMLVDGQGKPIANRPIRLGILKQSVAQGNNTAERLGNTDAAGVARFTGLEVNTAISYRVTVKEGPANYASAPFNLQPDRGQRVRVQVFPVTRDIRETSVGMRAIVYIEPRDDVFQFNVMFRIVNVDRVTWVPNQVTMRLPRGSKAFVAEEAMSDVRFTNVDDVVRLEGTISPGQHDVSYRFQVPNHHRSVARFSLPLLPHVAEARVMVESAPGMELDVDGFAPAERAANQNGQRVLVSARQLRSMSDPALDAVDVTLSGIPTPGIGRWVASGLALALALAGGFGLLTRRERKTKSPEDVARAREVILQELVLLERAKASGEIGPSTYESTRRVLSDALLRLERRSATHQASTETEHAAPV